MTPLSDRHLAVKSRLQAADNDVSFHSRVTRQTEKMYVVFLTVLVFSPILCGASCECNGNVMDCRTDGMSAVKLEGCTEARSVFVRGFCVGLVDHRGSTLDSITLFESSMSCEDLTAAVGTKIATVNGKPC